MVVVVVHEDSIASFSPAKVECERAAFPLSVSGVVDHCPVMGSRVVIDVIRSMKVALEERDPVIELASEERFDGYQQHRHQYGR